MDDWVTPFSVHVTFAVPEPAEVDEANGKTTKPSLNAVWGPGSKPVGVLPLLNLTEAVQTAPGVVCPKIVAVPVLGTGFESMQVRSNSGPAGTGVDVEVAVVVAVAAGVPVLVGAGVEDAVEVIV